MAYELPPIGSLIQFSDSSLPTYTVVTRGEWEAAVGTDVARAVMKGNDHFYISRGNLYFWSGNNAVYRIVGSGRLAHRFNVELLNE